MTQRSPRSPRCAVRTALALTTAVASLGLTVITAGPASAAVPAELLVSSSYYPHGVRAVPSGAGTPSVQLPNATSAVLSPDGSRMVFRRTSSTPERWVLATAAGVVQRDLFATAPQLPGNCANPSWSPDGSKIVLSCGQTYDFVGSQIYQELTVVDVATGAATYPLPQGRYSDIEPRWSPRGDWIAFTRTSGPYQQYARSRTMLVRPDGTGMITLSAAATLSEHSPAFSPDGSEVAFVSRAYERQSVPVVQEDLVVARLIDGVLRRVTGTPTSTTATRYLSAPDWSPDGSTIALLEAAVSPAYPLQTRVALVPATGGALTYAAGGAIMDGGELAWRAARTSVPAGSPVVATRPAPPVTTSRNVAAPSSGVADGALAYTSSTGVYAVPAVGGTPVQLATTVHPQGLAATRDGLRFSFDRSSTAVPGEYQMRTVLRTGGSGVQLYSGVDRCSTRSWLDATRVGVECINTDAAFVSTFRWGVFDTVTRALQVVRNGQRFPVTPTWQDTDPVWSPDGSMIAFERRKADGSEPRVMLMNADGTNVRSSTTASTTADAGDHDPAWTPAGSLVVATSRFATLDPLFHEDLGLTVPGTGPMLRLTGTASVSNVRIFSGSSVAPAGTRVLVQERTSILGDGGGRSHPMIYTLTPPTLAGTPGTELRPVGPPPGSGLTAWARG